MTDPTLLSPWDRLRVGPVWHGYQGAGGAIFSRLTGAQIVLPSGLQYFHPGDGGARIVDFGMPPVETTDTERAAGMCWVNNAVFSGFLRNYVCVRSGGALNCNLGRTGWLYRCPDGTCYVLHAYADKIFAKIVDRPREPQFGVPGSGTQVFDFSSTGETVGTSTTPVSWVNFSRTGMAAAIHLSAVRNVASAILEVAISGGSRTVAPTVVQTRYRAGGALVTSEHYVPQGTGWHEDTSLTGDKFWRPFWGIGSPIPGATWGDGQNGWSIFVGRAFSVTRSVKAVDYDAAGVPCDIGIGSSEETIIQATFGQDDSDNYMTQYQDVVATINYYDYIFAGDKLAYMRRSSQIYPAARYYRNGMPSVNPYTTGGQTAGVSPYLANGQTMVYSTTGPIYDSIGRYAFNAMAIYGYAGVAGSAGDVNTALGNSAWGNFSVDPFTGIFTAGRGPYF